MIPEEPSANPNGSESSEDKTSQMPAVTPAAGPDPVVWPEDPWEADGRAANDPGLEGGPVVTSPVIPTWPESSSGEPSVPSHAGRNPTDHDPVTAPFATVRPQDAHDERAEDKHDTVPPAQASAAEEEVDTKDAALETVPPEVVATDPPESEDEEAVTTAAAEEVEAAMAAVPEPEAPEAAEEDEKAAEPEPEPEPVVASTESVPELEAQPEPEPAPVTEPEPEPVPESVISAETEPPPLEPATPAAGTPVWAAQTAPQPTEPPAPAAAEHSALPTAAVSPVTPAPATAPFKAANPAIPSWAPGAPAQPAEPVEAPTQWPGINVPAWAPQPSASHPGTNNPLPGAGGPYADPARASWSSTPAQPAPAAAPAPAPVQASTPAPAPAPTQPAVASQPAPAASAPPAPVKGQSASWQVVEQKREAEPVRQGPTAEDKSYAEWFAWAKRSGAPASACHAAAQGAFRALAAGHDMNTAVQWATLAMSSPPGLVGQSRQLYCAWYSLGNIDLKLPNPQAHAFANGAIQALEQGADSMGAHQAGLMAAGITGG